MDGHEGAGRHTGATARPTTSGRYRVLPPEGDVRPLLDVSDYEPTRVRVAEPGGPRTGTGTDAVADTGAASDPLTAGNLVEATLAWADGEAHLADHSVTRETRYEFADGVTDLFAAARETFRAAERAGDGVGSRVTHNTDGEPNGVVYTFAEPPGRDLFAEFRRGHRPIDPLVERVNESRGASERAAFVLRPAGLAAVVVTVAFRRDGLFAETMRETYC